MSDLKTFNYWVLEIQRGNPPMSFSDLSAFNESAVAAFHALSEWILALGEPKGYLLTGSRIYEDSVVERLSWAEERLESRKGDGSRIVPLYARPEAK